MTDPTKHRFVTPRTVIDLRRPSTISTLSNPVLDAEPKAEDTPNSQPEAKAKPTTEGRTGTANVPTGTNPTVQTLAPEELQTESPVLDAATNQIEPEPVEAVHE